MSSTGMMDPCFFVGRKQLIEWINDTFKMNVQKIEDTASGKHSLKEFEFYSITRRPFPF